MKRSGKNRKRNGDRGEGCARFLGGACSGRSGCYIGVNLEHKLSGWFGLGSYEQESHTQCKILSSFFPDHVFFSLLFWKHLGFVVCYLMC